MSGPWEDFKSADTAGPWEEFSPTEGPKVDPRAGYGKLFDKPDPAYEEYKKRAAAQNLQSKKEWESRAQIPGAAFTPKEPLSYKDWLGSKEDPSLINRTLGKPLDWIQAGAETALSLGTGVGAALAAPFVIGGMKALGDDKPAKKMFEDILEESTYQPRGKLGQDILEAIGPVMQAFPATGGYTGQLGKIKKPKPSFDAKLETIKPRVEPTLETPTGAVAPQQLELPLATSPEAIAEMRGRGTGQPDFFFSDQANAAALGEGGFADARAASAAMRLSQEQARMAAAQDALLQRQRALEEGVARTTAEEAIARQRAATLQQGADTLARTDTGLQRHQEAALAAETEAAGSRPMLQHQDALDFTPHGDRPAQYGFTDTGGRVDENGIPIRADLSMEAQNLQNPLQRNLWGDELPGKTGDGGVPLTRAIDKMPTGPEREMALRSLQYGYGVGVGGPRGAQRGAIDVRGVKQALDDLRKGLIKGPEALRAFVGTFDPQSDHSDIAKGIGGGHIGWFPAIQASRSLKSEGRLVWMSPDEFHDAALPRHMDSTKKNGIGERKRESIRIGINEPSGLTSIPVLRVVDGKVVGHEGRHRMDVMRELGIKKAPVYFHTTGHSNGDGAFPFKFLVSEDGSQHLRLPETIFPMGNEPLFFSPSRDTGIGPGRVGPSGGITRGAIYGWGKSPQSRRDAFMRDDPVTVLDESGLKKTRQDIVQDILKTSQRASVPMPDEIISSALGDGKDGKGSVWFAAGATLEALKRRSPLIQGVSRVVQHFKNVADSSIRESVFPFEDAVRRLSRTEVEQLSKVLKAEMFNRQTFDMAKLADIGLSEKQLLAYSRIREMFTKALEAQNRAREARGLKPITELDAYLSSRWQGDFRRVFRDADGKLVWALAANTKQGLEAQTRSLLKEVPGLTHEDHTVKSARGWRPDYTQVYQTMIDVLGDDPASAKAKAWYESQIVAAAAETKAQEKHFKPKGNVRGFVGDRPGHDGFKESLAMLQQQINYAKNAHRWSAMQHAGQQLKDVFSSKELAEQQPNNMRYAREYFADNIGANELAWVKALEDGIRDLGVSPNTIGSSVGTLKALWVGQKLAANAGFMVSNVLQTANMLPTLAFMKSQYGGNPITAIPSGMLLGSAMAISHVLGGKGEAVYKSLGQVPGLPTEFITRAMKFAEDNSVIAKSVYDESPIGTSFGIGGLTNKIASKTISLPETFLRSVVYMTYVSQLKSGGKFANDLDLFRVADEHTRASMGDYGEGERAMAFNKLGNVGNAANVLQTFPINYFNQWSWVGREAAKGNVTPFVTMLAVQASVAGAMGVPGFTDADKIVEWIKDYVKETSPKMWTKIKDFSLKEMVIKLGGESALYGPLSTQTGVALTNRAAAPAATEMAATPGAPWADAASQLGSVASAVTDPLNPQKRAQALFDIAPAGLQGYLETGPFKEFTSVTRPDGSTVYGKPSKMAAREGVYARTPEEETLRMFGFRSQKEAATKDALYRARKGEADVKSVIAKLPDKVWNELRLGRKDKAQELFQLHVELSGRGISKQAITEQLRKEYMTQAEQMITRKNQTVEGLIAYKRFQDMMKEMGYSQ